MVKSRLQGTAAFLLISLFCLLVTNLVTMIAGFRNWSGPVATIAVLSSSVSSITLWLSIFIAVGTPNGSVSSDPLWLTVYAAFICLGGVFFALHSKAHGAPADPKAVETQNPAAHSTSAAVMGSGGAPYSTSYPTGTGYQSAYPYADTSGAK